MKILSHVYSSVSTSYHITTPVHGRSFKCVLHSRHAGFLIQQSHFERCSSGCLSSGLDVSKKTNLLMKCSEHRDLCYVVI